MNISGPKNTCKNISACDYFWDLLLCEPDLASQTIKQEFTTEKVTWSIIYKMLFIFIKDIDWKVWKVDTFHVKDIDWKVWKVDTFHAVWVIRALTLYSVWIRENTVKTTQNSDTFHAVWVTRALILYSVWKRKKYGTKENRFRIFRPRMMVIIFNCPFGFRN